MLWASMKNLGSAPEKCVAHWHYDTKTSKTVSIIRAHCSPENIIQKYQTSSVHDVCTPINWPKDFQKFNIYTNEKGMYELLFSSQQPRVKDFRRHCCNVLFTHVWHQLSDKVYAVEIKDITNHVQALDFTNEQEYQAHQQEILRLNEEHRHTIIYLKTLYIDHARDPGKDNIIITVRKYTTPANDKFPDLLYYVARTQRRKRHVKLRWFDRHFRDHNLLWR